jgi:membrane protease YdiL (CAAX protease family)
MNHFINRRHYASPRYFDEEISRKERSEIWRWYLLAFTGTFAIYYFVSTEIFVPASLLTLPFIQAVTLSMSQAVAEEQFFRGFLLDYIYDRLKSSTIVKLPSLQLIPSIIGGSIFTVYHYWRYSLHPDVMMYIFFTGILMSWICLKSRRLSPVLLSHVLVNLIATSMQGG